MSLFFAFVAGLLTLFNPCVLPLAPIVVASAGAKDARGPLALAFGLALTFGVVGGIIASLGVELGESAPLRIGSALAMILIGLAMIVPRVAEVFSRVLAPAGDFGNELSNRLSANGLMGQALLGAVLAIAWGPCVGPTLGAALVLAAKSGTLPLAMLTMALFALGAATSLLVAGYGLGKLTQKSKAFARWSAYFGRAVFGGILLLIGLGLLTGVNQTIEQRIAEAMPDWLVTFATRF